MMPLDDKVAAGRKRFTHQNIADGEVNYKDYLVDITGRGEKRYLIVSNNSSVQYSFAENGYLIDTKENFAIIGRIPVGEVYDYPMPNMDFTFVYSDEIPYLTTRGAACISVKMRLEKGKEAVCVSTPMQEFPLQQYRQCLDEKLPKDMVMAQLYCNLASAGLLKQSRAYARQLGFDYPYFFDIGGDCLKKIRQSELYKYIAPLNGLK